MSQKLRLVGLLFAFSAIYGLTSAPCSAQRVRVGGGGVRVRAPFVRVDVGPYGGVSVRAPFAGIDVPPDDYYGPTYGPTYGQPRMMEQRAPAPARTYATAADFAAMDADQLNQALRGISQSLHERLRRFDTADTWQRYLRFPDAATDTTLPIGERTESLTKLLDRFHKVADDPQYSMIARLPEFVAMNAGINEALLRSDGSQIPTAGAANEDLPLPAPQQPAPADRERSFLQPRQPQ